MSKTDRTGAKKPSTDGVPPESLDQVRDILFGGQMRTVETRLQSVEERLSREQESMRAEFAKRVSDLDAALKSLVADIKDAQKAMDKRHAALEQSTSLSDAELREALVAQSRVDRATLGALLTDIAGKLVDGSAKGGKSGKV